MPTERLQDARNRYGCPACGSMNTQRASTAVEDRIRNAIAAHWAEPPGPRGPDGRWLRSVLVAWAGLLVFAFVTSSSHLVAGWEWAALLLAAVLLGVWLDRRAALRRGWVDPLQRTAELAQRARERDAAALAEPARRGRACTEDDPSTGPERVCLHCGHRFEPASAAVSTA